MPNESREDKALEYGWSLAVLKSVPELNKLFDKAVGGSWTANKFVAELRDTKWFKTHSETYRQAFVLQKTDPATFKRELESRKAALVPVMQQLGLPASNYRLDKWARDMLFTGADPAAIQYKLAKSVNWQALIKSGSLDGGAESALDEMKAIASKMGVKVSTYGLSQQLRRRMMAGADASEFQNRMRDLAKATYAAYADQIDQGMTVEEIAEPYKQSMAQLLEVNPDSLDVWDPTIRQALTARGPDGKPATTSIWEFEQKLRKDKRWLKTKNAQNDTMSVGRQVLRDMGFAGN